MFFRASRQLHVVAPASCAAATLGYQWKSDCKQFRLKPCGVVAIAKCEDKDNSITGFVHSESRRQRLLEVLQRCKGKAVASLVPHSSPSFYEPVDWCMAPYCRVYGFPPVDTVKPCAWAPKAGLIAETLLLQTVDQCDAPVLLVKPDQKPPDAGWPVVLVFPHTGHCKEGAQPLLEELAQKGCIAVCMDNRHQGERAGIPCPPTNNFMLYKVHCDSMVSAAFQAACYGSKLEQPYIYDTVWDAMQLLDCLCLRPDVNAHRICSFGESFGGTIATYHAAVDKRVRACCNFIGLQGFAWGLENGDAWRGRADSMAVFKDAATCRGCDLTPEIAREVYETLTPGLLAEHDMNEILTLIAPRAFLSVASVEDQRCPIGGVRACIEYAQHHVKSLNLDPDCIQLDATSTADIAPPLGHGLSPAMYARGLDFVCKHLFS